MSAVLCLFPEVFSLNCWCFIFQMMVIQITALAVAMTQCVCPVIWVQNLTKVCSPSPSPILIADMIEVMVCNAQVVAY